MKQDTCCLKTHKLRYQNKGFIWTYFLALKKHVNCKFESVGFFNTYMYLSLNMIWNIIGKIMLLIFY